MAEKKTERPETIKRIGLADPRSGGERIAAMINRVASGNRNAPVRKWDDTPGMQRRHIEDAKRRRGEK